MNQNRKYLGMTDSQIGILVALAGALLLILCAASWLIFGDGLSFARPPENTPVPQSTPTLIVIPTFTPTALPTTIPYDQLIPNGWVQHKTALVELWLPPGYKKAGSSTFSGISGDSVFLELGLTGTASSSSPNKVNVSVFYEALAAESLDAFLDLRLLNIPPEITLTGRSKVFINAAQARSLLFEGKDNNVFVNDLLFAFLDGSTVWYVRYSAEINDFYATLETFHDSVQTFRVVK